MATPMRVKSGTTADDVARMRVLTITITAPQHAQSIAGRSLHAGMKRFGSNFSKRCSKAIRRLQLACRKPKLRARRKPLGSTCWRRSQRNSTPPSVRLSDLLDMRVEVEPTRVRVQDRDRPRRPLQLPVVLTEAQHRFPGTAHQGIEDDVGVRRSESAPLGRQREGQQKMVGRDQPLHLTLQPLLALVVLAVRIKAMAAGM